MALAADGAQHDEIDLAAAATESIGELPREFWREIAVIVGRQPGHGNAGPGAEPFGRLDEALRRADLARLVVSVTAAARREHDDARNAAQPAACYGKGSPPSRRVPDHDSA